MYSNGTLDTYYSYARQSHSISSATSSGVSRVTTDSGEWSMVIKLLLLSSLATVGTIGNIFAISAVMLDDHLKRKGNVFIANLAFADFIVSAFAIPATSVTILAGKPDNMSVCTFQWVAGILCYHVSVLTLMFVALESHGRILSSTEDYERLFAKPKIVTVVSGIWLTSTVCVACQFLLGLGPDYCRMKFRGNILYHLVVGTALTCVPTVLAFSAYFRCLFALKDTTSLDLQNALLTSPTLAKDVNLMKTNFVVFLVFLAFWFPLGITMAIGSLHPISRILYEQISWLAFSNSCFNSFVYGIGNRYFRGAYNKLFHYCFCKTSVSFGREGQRRPVEPSIGCVGLSSNSITSTSATPLSTHGHHYYHHHHHHHNPHHHHHHHHHSVQHSQRPGSDVRVHIIPGYNIYAPQRSRTEVGTNREMKTFKNTSKHVYEL